MSRDDFTIPPQTLFVELQAETNHVRYTMDGATDPTTSTGMLFLTSHEPKLFVLEDLLKLRIIRDGGSDSKLNFHYGGTKIP